MATSSTPFRRTGVNSWEELLDQVNEQLENPPEDTDCEPIEPIETPGEMHLWSKSDIQEVHDKLNQMPGGCFSFQTIPDLWKVSIIEDIESQLGNSWCECEPEECDPLEGQGDTFHIVDIPITHLLPCERAKPVETTSVANLVGALNVGVSGIVGRIWLFQIRTTGTPGFPDTSFSTLTGGQIDCFGNVIFGPNHSLPTITTNPQSFVFFGPCGFVGSFPCKNNEIEAACQEIIDSLFVGEQREYQIKVFIGSSAECEDCEE